jgi:hypothetical protein
VSVYVSFSYNGTVGHVKRDILKFFGHSLAFSVKLLRPEYELLMSSSDVDTKISIRRNLRITASNQ